MDIDFYSANKDLQKTKKFCLKIYNNFYPIKDARKHVINVVKTGNYKKYLQQRKNLSDLYIYESLATHEILLEKGLIKEVNRLSIPPSKDTVGYKIRFDLNKIKEYLTTTNTRNFSFNRDKRELEYLPLQKKIIFTLNKTTYRFVCCLFDNVNSEIPFDLFIEKIYKKTSKPTPEKLVTKIKDILRRFECQIKKSDYFEISSSKETLLFKD